MFGVMCVCVCKIRERLWSGPHESSSGPSLTTEARRVWIHSRTTIPVEKAVCELDSMFVCGCVKVCGCVLLLVCLSCLCCVCLCVVSVGFRIGGVRDTEASPPETPPSCTKQAGPPGTSGERDLGREGDARRIRTHTLGLAEISANPGEWMKIRDPAAQPGAPRHLLETPTDPRGRKRELNSQSSAFP